MGLFSMHARIVHRYTHAYLPRIARIPRPRPTGDADAGREGETDLATGLNPVASRRFSFPNTYSVHTRTYARHARTYSPPRQGGRFSFLTTTTTTTTTTINYYPCEENLTRFRCLPWPVLLLDGAIRPMSVRGRLWPHRPFRLGPAHLPHFPWSWWCRWWFRLWALAVQLTAWWFAS